ncbi:hypothetical protein KJ611_03345 [Patescibacteria group bacterium]|nr:hypothetical protein [Patescibacteria group bacterium]
MQKLNIPMRNSYKTTRRSRRVVWILLLALLLTVLAYCASFWWFSRQTISEIVPDGTIAIIRLAPDRNTWPIIEKNLLNIPLITGKSLTISDLVGFAQGEVAIYIQNDGNMSVGIRGSLNTLPRDELDAQGIVVREIGPNHLFLANQIMPFSTTQLKRGWNLPNIPFMFETKLLGQILILNDPLIRGDIYGDGNNLEISLPKSDLTALPWKTIPEDVFGIMSTPFLTNFSVHSNLPVYPLIEEFDQNLASFTRIFEQNIELVMLSNDEDGVGFLISSYQDENDPEMHKKLIKLSAALHSPRISDFVLSDNSTAQEISVDPAAISVEELVIAGVPWSRVLVDPTHYLFSGYDRGRLVISNREALVRFWLTGEDNSLREAPCGGTSGFMNVDSWVGLSANNLHTRNWQIAFPITEAYSSVGIRNSLFDTKILLCN